MYSYFDVLFQKNASIYGGTWNGHLRVGAMAEPASRKLRNEYDRCINNDDINHPLFYWKPNPLPDSDELWGGKW